jgi:hypothetical protein
MVDLSDFGLAPAGFGAPSPVAQSPQAGMPADIPTGGGPSVPWPHDDPSSWDTLYLGGQWPGLAVVKVKGGQKIDRKKGAGAHGETITFQGKKAADVDIVVRVWQATPDQWSWMQAMIALIEPIAGKADPTPYDIAHPATSVRHISSVAVEDIEGPDWDAATGFMSVHIKAIEYLPPPKANATATPTGSTPSQWVDKSPTPSSFLNGVLPSTSSPSNHAMLPPSANPDALNPGV